MNTLAYKTASPKAQRPSASVLVLRATDDGWALLDAGEEVVFSAAGLDGRRACLAFAREAGVLALIT